MKDPSQESIDFVEGVADRQLDLEDFYEENRDDVDRIYLELLNNPDRRSVTIEEKYINFFLEQSLESFGDPELSELFWAKIADAVDISFDDLNTIPTNKRGNEFHTIRNTMSAVCWEQAFIEAGFADYCVRTGIINGKILQAQSKDLKIEEFKGGMPIKEIMKRKKEERIKK